MKTPDPKTATASEIFADIERSARAEQEYKYAYRFGAMKTYVSALVNERDRLRAMLQEQAK